jgi:alpha-glucoside transport system permease protein
MTAPTTHRPAPSAAASPTPTPGSTVGVPPARRPRRPRPTRRRASRRAGPSAHLWLLLICGLWAVPALSLFVNSFRDPYAIANAGWWTALRDPVPFTLENYRRVIVDSGMGTAFVNSLLIAVPAVAMMTSVGAISSFALARMRFRGRRLLLTVLLGVLVIPVQMTLVPILRLYNATHLTGTFVGIWLVHLGFALPFAIYLMRSFFAALPAELFEAAALDGASDRVTFLRVALPVATPALASVAIFQLIWVWNDLLIALIFLGGSSEVAPITVATANLVNATTGQGWELLTAAAFVAMALPMAVFFALQRHFVRGLLAGTGK